VATVGVDIGGTKLLAVRVVDGDVVDEARLPNSNDPKGLSQAVIDGAAAVWAPDVVAVGAGVAGLVRFADGLFVWGPHVAGTRVPVRSEVEARLGVPVVVDNDANAALHCELFLGAAQGCDDVLLATLGTGIGGALAHGGTVVRGVAFAGEIGHVSFDPAGDACACGRRGCWETVASGPALVRMAVESGEDLTSAEDVVAAAAAGNEVASRVVRAVGTAFGLGLADLVAVVDPEIIVVGGGLGSVGAVIIEPAREALASSIHGGSQRTVPPIVVARLGDRAGAVGAAVLAADLVTSRLQR
jgi:glucokinase